MSFMQIKNVRWLKLLTRRCSQLAGDIKPVEQSLKYKIKHLDYKDPLFSEAMLNVKSKKGRLKSGLIALEGKRLIQDALNVGVKPIMIFYSSRDDIDQLTNLDRDIQFYKTPYKDMKLWSDLTTPPGIIAFCNKPEPIAVNSNSIPVTVVCDQVREPGNLGAVFRSAAGAGIQKVILTKGCVDLWEPKVLRGASGAHFHLPIHSNVTWDDFPKYINSSTNFLLAVHKSSSMYFNLPCYPYYKIDYKSAIETVVVIGGETEGLSKEVFELANELNGKAINIPLSNNIDCLNCVSAMSIILFEIKRQLSL